MKTSTHPEVTYIFVCMILHTFVYSINLVPFVKILSYTHSLIKYMVNVCRLRRQYGFTQKMGNGSETLS